MTNKNDGGPAFPANHFDLAPDEHGMTLRDWFAGQALIHLCMDYMAEEAGPLAYDYADQMLKAREVEP